MTDAPFTTTRDAGVFTLTLHRGKANAIDAATSFRMGEAFAAFRDDPEMRVGLVCSGNEKFFSAGWDLVAAAAGEPPDVDYGVGGFAGLQMLPDLNKPVIAAVGGLCVGGGFELALACDLIVASTAARFSLPEIKAGTLADAATIKLPRRIPYHVAMHMLFTGRWMEADEADRRGLLSELVEPGQLMPRARELARLLADGPPLVFAALKQAAREMEGVKFHTALPGLADLPTVRTLYSSEDQKEGPRAFAEKRAPVWKGR
jgi:crotonobetainyl-CoA hydratase